MRGVWLSVSEAARYLGVSDPTLRKWTDRGLIQAWRTPGGHRRYLLESLNDFRDSRSIALQESEEEEAANGSAGLGARP